MKNFRLLSFTLFLFTAYCCLPLTAQIPQATMVRIVRAEDELRFDKDLQDLLKSPDALTRKRAALAAGRIGNEKAVPFLAELLEKDASQDVRVTAAFAIGEVESKTGADAVLKILAKKDEPNAVRARALEAAGKIAAAIAANNKEKSAELGKAVLNALEAEHLKTAQNKQVVLLGLTAALRAKPDGTDMVVAKFLSDKDARVRADALNTLVRLRAKSDDLKERYRALLKDSDPIIRANAARALGASEDANAIDLLIQAATNDTDQRVRVAATRSLAALKNPKAAEPLLTRGEKLLTAYKTVKIKNANPAEKSELLEIAVTLGRIVPKTEASKTVEFLSKFRDLDKYQSPETEIALARVAPDYLEFNFEPYEYLEANDNWHLISSLAQGFAELANFQTTEVEQKVRVNAENALREPLTKSTFLNTKVSSKSLTMALPDVLRAFANYKTADLAEILRKHLKHEDVIVRATAAELISEQPVNQENVIALTIASAEASLTDNKMNDAQLAILSALVKLDKKKAVLPLESALKSDDFLVRRHAVTLIKQSDLLKDFPNVDDKVGTLQFYTAKKTLTLGVILNQQADYIRALSRKNGQTKAVLTMEKGTFTIDLLPEDAPLTVDNFVQLAKKNYFNGIAFHRVVPNFVVQGGDLRGDGNGGPGWQIRCEINMVEYERGAVGMALSGKDTGGSQWFVTHSPQPHLDGGYTVFGKVNETDLKIVDSIARGDKILSVKIIEGNQPQRTSRTK